MENNKIRHNVTKERWKRHLAKVHNDKNEPIKLSRERC